MATEASAPEDIRPNRQRLYLTAALLVAAPGVTARILSVHVAHVLEAAVFGVAIVGAAFLLSWAAETAQIDISAGLATAVLAFIAVLPEYAVDVVFAWKAGHGVKRFGAACKVPGAVSESPCSLALANMTGANRLLIGIGWSLVVVLAWWQWRRRGRRVEGVVLDRTNSVELSFLVLATAYSLTLPLKRTVTLVDAVILVAIFVAYMVRISRAPAEEPHLVGPSRYLASFSPNARRAAVGTLFVVAAGVILLCAERFAEALVGAGADLGISEFLLVQWLAPLASEAPELLVAGLYAWKLRSSLGLGTLVSAKVNQWTLLVGTLPIVFAMASGSTHGLPIDPAQREELLLTAAQSVFAVAILSNLELSIREAGLLFGLFWAQFLIGALVPGSAHGVERIVVSVAYLSLAALYVARNRGRLGRLLKDGFRTPYEQLAADD